MIYWVSFYIIMSFIILVFKKYNFVPWVIMCFILAFRYKFGTDYLVYTDEEYYNILNGLKPNYEILHTYLVYFTEYLGFNQQFIFAIYAILTTILFYKFSLYFSKNNTYTMFFTLFIFLLLFLKFIDQIRSCLAIAIFLYSTRFIIERKLLKYIFCCLLAYFSHKSAIILLPMYWILNIKYTKKTFYLLVLFMMAIPFINTNHVIFLIDKIISILNLAKYSMYFEWEINLTFIGKIATILYILIFVVFYRIFNKEDKKEHFVINAMIIYLLIKSLQIHFGILGRISAYFSAFNCVFIVFVIMYVYKRIIQKDIFVAAIIVTLIAVSIYPVYLYYNEWSAAKHFAFNFSLFSKEDYVIQIFGDHNKAFGWIHDK